MSTHIIDALAALKVPKDRSGYYYDYYFLFSLGGDNNVFNCDTGRRARQWSVIAAGPEYQCLATACGLAAGFCGGMVRMGNFTPEGFIKRCRQLLAAALDYDDRGMALRLTQLAITFSDEEKAQGGKYAYDRLVTKRGEPERRSVYLRGDVWAFPFRLDDPRDVACFIEHLPYKSSLWDHVKVTGPGEE